MEQVRAKKSLGQHFLTDESIAERIAHSLTGRTQCLLEIGPGMGVLTKYLVGDPRYDFKAIELDRESVDYLRCNYPSLNVIEGDFLRLDLESIFGDKPFAIIGNFPYNISSQILFRVFEQRNHVPEVVGMFDDYRNRYEQERQIQLQDQFDVSEGAVKKQNRLYKSVIKLDKNFHIYVHGSRQLIEQGEDEHGKFYKLYFNEES